MHDTSNPAEPQDPPHVPTRGTLLVDAQDKIGEFRGEAHGLWYLRPITGGCEWSVRPEDARPAGPEQRLRAETTRANARSRDEYL
ncbi:hypothetical protein V1460_32420 [Streptomyces sp. SCSIO 30461]|uniref:hypothetical protein n=1 Tax=Streptomyces sp. SCSIO 30461 TaxID=3118085 RepID=UPI0030CBD169